MNQMTESLVTIAVAIVGVAILSVLVSRNSQTPSVLRAAGNAFSTALGAATAPVTGGGMARPNSYPSGAFGGMQLGGIN